MAVVVELRRPGANGRCWLLHPRSRDERARLAGLAHYGRCQLGMSVRQVQRYLAENGAAVSRGCVWNWLTTDWECDRCAAGVTNITTGTEP